MAEETHPSTGGADDDLGAVDGIGGQSEYVIALDSGSQSSRAILFDDGGSILASASRQHEPMKHPEEGAVEQDPEDIWSCLVGAIRDCLDQWGGDPSLIGGAALTTQRSVFIPTGAGGAPLGDALSWLDRRVADVKRDASRMVRVVLGIMGKKSPVPRLLSKSAPRLWKERTPAVMEGLETVSSLESWLLLRLVGRNAHAPGGVAGPWPFDAKRRTWTRSGLVFKLLGYDRAWLPDIVEAGQEVGRLTKDAGEVTGLPEGLPFFACGGDKQAESLGLGIRLGKRGVGAVSLGTGSSICVPWKKALASSSYRWVTMVSSEPGSWSLEYLLFRGLWTARWFARELARDLEATEEERGTPAEAVLAHEAGSIPPGSEGLVMWPRWSPTLDHPEETGTVVGLREIHTRAHMFRALMEGIAYDLRRGKEILEGATQTPITEVHVGGGGARSSTVVQILADVLGVPVYKPAHEELAARGAAMVAAVGAGIHGSLDDAVTYMVPKASRIDPIPANQALYDRLYRRVYLPGLALSRTTSSDTLDALRASH